MSCPAAPLKLHRRIPTELVGGDNVATYTVTRRLGLTSVAAVWQAGNAGPVLLAVDGVPVEQLDGGATGIAVFRFDRPEPVAPGATITVTMPTGGMVDINAEVTP